MIRTRGRKILRDVWARKGRTAMVALAIFIGVTGTIALFSMSDILISQLKEDVKQEELAMAQVSVSLKDGVQPDNAATLQKLSQFPGVTEITAGMEDIPVYFKTDPDDKEFTDGSIQAYVVLDPESDQPRLLSAPFEAPTPIEPYRMVKSGDRHESDGQWPKPFTLVDGQWSPDQNQLAVELRMADEYNLKVGDTLYLRVLSQSRNPAEAGATGTVEPWTITAIVFDPYAAAPKTTVYTDLTNANYLTGIVGINDFWVRFDDYKLAKDSLDTFQDAIANDTAYIPRFAFSEDPAKNSLITTAQLFTNLMSTLALIALVVSGFLVINVISSLVVEQKRQIGVMKSMGATRTDNFVIYSGIAFAYGVLAVIPGVIVGIPLGNVAAYALAGQLNTVLEGFRYSVPSIILGVVVGLLVPVIASILPVYNGTRVQILQAMTDLGIGASYGTGPMARLIGKLPVPITVRQGFSNVSLKKSRLAFTVLTLSIAAGAFMGIYGLFTSMKDGINTFIDTFDIQIGVAPTISGDPTPFETLLKQSFDTKDYLKSKLGYSSDEEFDTYFNGLSDDEKNALVQQYLPQGMTVEDINAKDNNILKSIEPGFSVQVEFEGYDPQISPFGPPGIFAYGYDVTSERPAFKFTIDKGEKLTPENEDEGIIFASGLANNMNKKVGDHVVMRVPGKTRQFTIVGISEFPLDQVWVGWKALAEIADYTYDTITSESPLPAGAIPAEASDIIKYATLLQVEGYETSGPMPGVLALGFTPKIIPYLTFDEGGFPNAGEAGLVITKAMAEKGGYSVGDQINIASEVDGGQSGSYTITGIFDPPALMGSAGGGAMSAQAAIPSDWIGMFWRDLATMDNASVESRLTPQLYFINTIYKDPSVDQMDNLVDKINDKMVTSGIPIFALNFVQLTQMISDGFFTIQAILSAVALLIALVGALGLLTTLSMSVYERQKEIGVMRSIGAGSSTVAIQFLTEGLVVGFISWLVGLVWMVIIQKLLLQIIGPELFSFEIVPAAIISGFIGMMVITTIASLWPSIAASRKTVSDILRYQ